MISRIAASVLLIICVGCVGTSLYAKDDFLTPGEVDKLRDTQEMDKRILLYLQFAQERIDAARTAIASRKAGSGQTTQKSLDDYNSIMDALDTTIQTARDKHEYIAKALEQLRLKGGDFLKFLQAIQEDPALDRSDYVYTLEEAIDMTRDELAEAKKGYSPAARPQEPAPPPVPEVNPPPASSSGSGDEEGPPRKKQ